MKRIIAMLGLSTLIALGLVAGIAAPAGATPGPDHKITICHAVEGQSQHNNGFNSNSIDKSGAQFEGHDGHSGDVIPAFGTYPGKNLDTVFGWGFTGQQLLDNGCKSPEEPFDWNWQYAAPTCDALTVVYPTNIPAGQANDVNVKIKNLDTNAEVTLNFHNNSGTWSGTKVFDFVSHANWPGWTHYAVFWTQVAGTNYHWQGSVECGTPPVEEPEPSVEFTHSATCGVLTLTVTNTDIPETWWYGAKAEVDGNAIGSVALKGNGTKSIDLNFTEDSYGGAVEVRYFVHASTEWDLVPADLNRHAIYPEVGEFYRTVTVTTDCETNIIPLPAQPEWVDLCGVDNGYWIVPENTESITWTVVDHTALNGKVGIVATITADNTTFPSGATSKQWTKVQDNTLCPETVTPVASFVQHTCSATGSMTLSNTPGVVWNAVTSHDTLVTAGTVLTIPAGTWPALLDGSSPESETNPRYVGSITLTANDADPNDGYIIDEQAQTEWVFTFNEVATPCATTPPEEPKDELAHTGPAENLTFGLIVLAAAALAGGAGLLWVRRNRA